MTLSPLFGQASCREKLLISAVEVNVANCDRNHFSATGFERTRCFLE